MKRKIYSQLLDMYPMDFEEFLWAMDEYAIMQLKWHCVYSSLHDGDAVNDTVLQNMKHLYEGRAKKSYPHTICT